MTSERLFQALLVLLLLPGCSVQRAQAANSVTLFKCAGAQSFTVERDNERAIVVYASTRYELPKRPSSIGQRYANSLATLIIDGDMAVFVTSKVMNLDFCRADLGDSEA